MTEAPRLSRLGQAAVAYAELGWPVFTLFPKGKRPMDLCPDCDAKLPGKDKETNEYPPCKVCGAFHEGDRGLYFATTDKDTIIRWWTKYPDANIGVRCGIYKEQKTGLLVLDVDVPDMGKGGDGEVTLARLLEQHGPLPHTPHQRTGEYKQEAGVPRRGWQYFFSVDVETHNSAGRLGQLLDEHGLPVKDENGKVKSSGIDTRGDGGYVVAAPSVHPSKVNYEWIRDPDSRPTRCQLAPAPAWLLEALKPKISEVAAPKGDATTYKERPKTGSAKDRWVNAAIDGEYRRMAEAGEGTRNEAINKAAFKLGQLVGGGLLSESDARATCEAGA